MTKSGIKQLVVKLFDHTCGISQRKAARKMKCTQPLVNCTFKNKISIRLKKKIKISTGNLCSNILDDGSYFTLTNSEMKGNDNFSSKYVEFTTKEIKYKAKDKFKDKLLVYVLISSLGILRLGSQLMEIRMRTIV